MPARHRLPPLAPLAALALALVACDADIVVPTQVLVHVRVEPSVRAAAATLQIKVEGGSGLNGGRFWADRTAWDGPPRALPAPDGAVTVALTPLGASPESGENIGREYRVTATALDSDGASVAVARVISGYRANMTLEYDLILYGMCPVTCSENETCRASGGECVDAIVPVAELRVRRDATDAGVPGSDGTLADLTVGAEATLSPAFSPSTMMYTLTLPPGTMSTTLTPTVAQPTRAMITVAGSSVASGASAVVSVTGFAPRILDVVVRAESGATRTYTIVVRRWPTYIKASNTDASDFFGTSVSVSADGTRLAVGAQGEASRATGINGDQSDGGAPVSGAVYVFWRTGTTWAQEAYIKASNTDERDSYGYAVSLSADGTRLAVGAAGEDSSATGVGGNQADNTAGNSGAAYVFSRSGTTWTQEAYVKASNTGADDSFGTSVSLSADGTRLAVGAVREDSNATRIGGNQADNSASYSGAVYVFSWSGTTWTQEAYVKASNTATNDGFGQAVSLSADGARLAVGAHGEDSSATGISGDETDDSASNSGAVYVFSRSGATWTQEAYVKASNTGEDDYFGYSVSLSANGTRLAVGAWSEDSSATGVGGSQADGVAGSGAAYVFARSGTTWTQDAYIKASNTGFDNFFGHSVSLSADGMRLAVGAVREDSGATGIDGDQGASGYAQAGATYVFGRSGATWTQEAYVKASNTDPGDYFGLSVSLSGDGTRLAVGAQSEASRSTGIDGDQGANGTVGAGAAYVY